MTRISKRIIGWILGALAFVAIAFGVLFALPQDKAAKADSVETTWAENLYVESIDNYTRYRINTSGLQWTAYNNTSYADEHLENTKLNGKTVKELNEAEKAKGGTAQIWACLQPASTFSFYSVCVPNSFSELLTEDIYSVSIEAGWTNTDSGTGNTYTNSTAVRYNNREGDWRLNTGKHADFSTASFTFYSQGDQGNGSTCFILNTKDSTNFWTGGGSVLKMNNPLLNAIYVNGKSVNDWNAEAQAAVDAGTVTDICYGSTNNQNVSAGAPIAVLPGYANNTENGAFFQIYIANNFLPASEIYSFEWKAGFEYMFTNTRDVYYTSKDVRFDLLGASWRLVTDFVDLDSGEMYLTDQKESTTGVNCFLIGFGGTQKYTNYLCLNDNYQKASPITGLTYGENLDYITINGKTIGQIKAENSNYDFASSTHPNIKNGGLYAPIFGQLTSGDSNVDGKTDNFIQIYIPTDLIDPSTITEIGLKSSLFNYSGTTKYGLTEDVTFVKKNGSWLDTRKMVSSENTTISAARVDGVENELYKVDITSSLWNSTCDPFDYNYGGSVVLRQNLLINGKSVHEINTTVDDSAYVYSTEPMTNSATYTYNGQTYDLFANPVILYGKGDTLTLWIHKDYMESLSGDVTVTLGENFKYLGMAMKESLSKVVATIETNEATVNQTEVTNVVYGDGLYLSFALSACDYPTKFTVVGAGYSEYDFLDKIKLTLNNGTEISLRTAVQGDWQYYYYPSTANTFAAKLLSAYRTTGATPPVQITIPAGTQFPSYNYTNNNGAKDVYETTSDIVFKSDDNGVTWYNPNVKYTVTFLNEDGSTFTTQEVAYGEKATAPTNEPTKQGTFDYKYVFEGWYQGETLFDFENTEITSNVTLTAKLAKVDALVEIGTEITGLSWNSANSFLSFTLGTHDYTNANGGSQHEILTGNGYTASGSTLIKQTNMLENIYVDGLKLSDNLTSYVKDKNLYSLFNLWNNTGDLGMRFYSYDENGEETTELPFSRLTIKAGCQFLSVAYAKGESKTLYVLEEDVTFVNWYGTIYNEKSIPATQSINVMHITYGEDGDNWLVFTIDEIDYPIANPSDEETFNIGYDNSKLTSEKVYEYNLFDYIELKDENGNVKNLPKEGFGDLAKINIWTRQNSFGIRIATGNFTDIESITIKAGCEFPSYQYGALDNADGVQYRVMSDTVFELNTEVTDYSSFSSTSTSNVVDMWMSQGASVRIAGAENYDANNENYFDQEGYKLSGIRFQTNVSKQTVARLEEALVSGTYTRVSFGTLIVPSQYLMGGQFTHAWLEASGKKYMDIESSAGIEKGWAAENEEYVTYYGSIVRLQTTNHARSFAGLGYVRCEKPNGDVEYFYAPYETSYARSAAYVAQLAIADRSNTLIEGSYEYKVDENNNYSPYTDNERAFLALYLSTLSESAISVTDLSDQLPKPGNTYTLDMRKNGSAVQIGSYIQLNYSTNINILGTLVYGSTANATTTVSEEFYLQAGTGEHKQYLDLFRTNGLGYYKGTPGSYSTTRLIDPNSVYLKEIVFKNAELKEGVTPQVQLVAFRSTYKTLDTQDLPNNSVHLYLTREQTEDKTTTDYQEVTVGANLALGGALTYLAKSGVYEGLTSSATARSSLVMSSLGQYSKGNVGMSTDKNTFGYTDPISGKKYIGGDNVVGGSKPGTGVNLINNWDVGRQIQQSYYAGVGGSKDATSGENGYTRAMCYTEDENGYYWPYNPVQAGDCGNNTSQIIDYEVNEAKNYIYVKTRAMDWSHGIDDKLASGKQTNAIEGGVTTKSYMENYYYLNADGTLKVDNSFVDWNGFTDMQKCDFVSNELPATFVSHNLQYYVSNMSTSAADAWTGTKTLTYTKRPDTMLQSNVEVDTARKFENWYAWSIDASGSFALGMYIPNVTNFSSSVIVSSDALSENKNANANNTGNKWASVLWTGSNMLYGYADIRAGWESCYVFNESYTAPSTSYRMVEYKTMQYSYVISLNSVETIYNQFKGIEESDSLTNGGKVGEKIGLDAWARMDKTWTW